MNVDKVDETPDIPAIKVKRKDTDEAKDTKPKDDALVKRISSDDEQTLCEEKNASKESDTKDSGNNKTEAGSPNTGSEEQCRTTEVNLMYQGGLASGATDRDVRSVRFAMDSVALPSPPSESAGEKTGSSDEADDEDSLDGLNVTYKSPAESHVFPSHNKKSFEESFTLSRQISQMSMIGYPDEDQESQRLEALQSAISLQAEAAHLRRIEFQRRQGELTRRKLVLQEKQRKSRNLRFGTSLRQESDFNLKVVGHSM